MKTKIALLTTALLFISLCVFPSVSAASPDISNSYQTTTAVPDGSLVSLVSGKPGYVQPANSANAQRLLGVIVASNESLLSINPSNSTVQVATEGTINALVSNINGNITAGQQVAVSPFNGVGMLAVAGDTVIGTAVTNFSSSTSGAIRESVTSTSGQTNYIYVGFVKLNISIGVKDSSGSGFSISFLQQAAQTLTGHTVSAVRVIFSMIIAIVVIVAIVTLIYASIHGSIVSVGRNPLAKIAVFRTLTSVIGMVIFIACVATLSIYLLLR